MKNREKDLELFFHKDIIDLKDYPIKPIQEKIVLHKTVYDFTSLKEPVKSELKLFLQYALRKPLGKASLCGDYLRPIHYIIGFIMAEDSMESISEFDEDMKLRYEDYLLKSNVSVRDSSGRERPKYTVLHKFSKFYHSEISEKDIFKRDIWDLSKIGVDKNRLVKSNMVNTLDFTAINNTKNKNLTKIYIKYLLTSTDKSISTIRGALVSLKKLMGFLGYKNLDSITRKDALDFLDYMDGENLNNFSHNAILFTVIRFINYMIVLGYMEVNHFYGDDIKKTTKQHTFKALEDSVINQIFGVLDKISLKESLMFLILYSTGMRISEVCELKVDSLIKNDKGCFLKFYSMKMRKEAFNPIPASLYNLLYDFRHEFRKADDNNEFMFLSPSGTCYKSSSYREKMRKWFSELEIKNPDGSLYVFKPHDFRHTLATQMLKKEIPISVIQKILHHDSIEMTVSYVDIDDRRKISKHKEFINIKGEKSPLIFENTTLNTDELAKVEWLKKSINAQMLPNGICSLPVKMGKCPHGNSCLTCEDFKTSEEFLPVHEKHYKQVCSLIQYSKEQGWERQLETNEEVKQNLEIIIANLKNNVEESKSGTEC